MVKLEYFDSDKEYLVLNSIGGLLYYINEEEDIAMELLSSYNFIILKNKDFISTSKFPSGLKYLLRLVYYQYPLKSNHAIIHKFSDLFVMYYQMIETSEAVLFFLILDVFMQEGPLEVYAFDKKTLNFNKTESLNSYYNGLTLIKLTDTSDNFIYCSSNRFNYPKCFPAKYKDKKIISGNPINVFDILCDLQKDFSFYKNYALLSNQTIAIICFKFNKLYLTIFHYKDDNLILGNISNINILVFHSHFKILNPCLIYYSNKGLDLYNIVEDSQNNKAAVYKSFIKETCSSFQITANAFTKTKIIFSEYITGRVNHSDSYFIITQIPIQNVSLLCDGKEIKPGNTVYNSFNVFYFTASDSDTPFVINFKNIKSNDTCNAIINIFHYQIKVMDKSYKCDKSPERILVNNITGIDLNMTYDLNIIQNVYFIAQFNKNLEGNDFIFKFSNVIFDCSGYLLNGNIIRCKVPIPINIYLFPNQKYGYEYDIYSKLSCLNDIYVGSIFIEDPYLIEIIEADNLTSISKKIDKNYDPSKRIDKFSVDMINYFYWFTSFGYCDENYIESGECCKEEILTDWELISHKKYIYHIQDYLNMLNINLDIDSLKKTILDERIQYVLDEYTKVYFYNYAILKSSKYKKYVFAFPGTTTYLLLLSEILLSEKVDFENNINIKVHKLFYLIFEKIKNDIFSEEILKDINSNKDYQIIFIGHSLGGAISTLASYYFATYNLAENEPVLITFGQPRVGNENFARDYMKKISNVYRIERYQDLVAMIPPRKKISEWTVVKRIKLVMNYLAFLSALAGIQAEVAYEIPAVVLEKDVIECMDEISEKIFDQIFDKITNKIIEKLKSLYPSGYCHIGGLYVINEESNKFYHCRDFYNNDNKSKYCSNWGITLGKVFEIPKYLENHHYLTNKQRPMERCQNNKDIRPFI